MVRSSNITFSSLCFLAIVILFFSCGTKKLDKNSLIRYVNHSKGLCKVQEVNGFKVQAKFLPYQLLVLQDLGLSKKNDTSKINALERKYSGQYYFQLSYSKNNKEAIRQLENFQRYSDMLQVMSFEMGKYIVGTNEKNDTLPLADYVFEQEYGMSSANNMMLVFKKESFSNSKQIDINIGEFGLGIGLMKFEFEKHDIEGIPLLSGFNE